jgi:hypothetical protein
VIPQAATQKPLQPIRQQATRVVRVTHDKARAQDNVFNLIIPVLNRELASNQRKVHQPRQIYLVVK